MNSDEQSPGSLDLGAILDRVADAAAVKRDSDLAAALGVSQQALSNWRVRGTIPYDRLFEFSAKTNTPLDYLFFGVGSRKRRTLDIDPRLLVSIYAALLVKVAKRPRGSRELTRGEEIFYSGLLYNRLTMLPDDDSRHEAIYREIDHLLSILHGVGLGDPLAVEHELAGGRAPAPGQQRPTRQKENNVVDLLGELERMVGESKPQSDSKPMSPPAAAPVRRKRRR